MKWVDIQWFGVSDIGSSSSDTGGSGATPTISFAEDYWLRDESGNIITDESGEPLSLEV